MQAVEIRDVSRLAEALDAQGMDAVSGNGAEPGQRGRVAVDHGDERGVRGEVGEQPLDMRASPPALAARGKPAGVEPICGRHRQDPRAGNLFLDLPVRSRDLGRDGAGIDDGKLGPGRGRHLPVGARQEIGPEGLAHLPLGLGDGPGREPEVDGAPVLGLHALEAPAHDLCELVDEGRLECGDPVQAQADEGRDDGLVRAALGGQADAGRGGHHHEAGALVAGVVERVEPTEDERVVERSHREEPRPEKRCRQPERRQQEEEVVLGDAELEVLPAG